MAQTSWPFENIDTTETQFSQWARNINEGINQGSGDQLAVTADGTGMTVSVGTGQAMIRGHYYSSTATESLTITAADPTNPRIDSVVLELDPTANTVLLKVLAGTPDASPVAPTLTQTDAGVYQLRLANIQVDAATLAIESGDVIDKRYFMGSAFGRWTTATRPENPDVQTAIGYNEDEGLFEYWSGADWEVIGSSPSGTWYKSEGPLSYAPNIFTTGTVYSVEVFSLVSNTLTLLFLDAAGNTLQTITVENDQAEFFSVPSGTDKFLFSSNSFAYFVIGEIEATIPTPLASIAITTSQSITLDKNYIAVVIGGGGAGGGTAANVNAGGGGGSGYMTIGNVTPGTYTATLGAGGVGSTGANGTSGGTTTFGALSANGGAGGNSGTVNSAGGNGGSGGGAGAITGQSGSGGLNGWNGSNGGSTVGGAPAGTGSGVQMPPLAALIFSVASVPGSRYAGGYGGSVFSFAYSEDGASATGVGGGGNGGNTRNINGLEPQRAGGNGFAGGVYLIEAV